MRLAVLIFAILFGLPAVANTYLERIDAAIATGSTETLEAEVTATHATAVTPEELEDFWLAFDLAFDATNPSTQRLISEWHEAHPDSAFAMTAMATALSKRAFLHRGAGYGHTVKGAFLEAYLADRERAATLALQAIQADDRMVWAYFTLFVVVQTSAQQADIDKLISDLVRVFPHPRAVNAATSMFHPAWGGSVEQMLEVCAAHAPSIPGYDAEACGAYAMIRNAPNDRRTHAAREALWARDEPWLDDLKFHDFYEHGGLDPGNPQTIDWAIEYHRASLDALTDPAKWWHQATQLAFRYQMPLYDLEAEQRVMPFLRAMDQRDPYDYYRIRRQIEAAMLSKRRYDGVFEEDLQAWALNTLVYGRHDGEIWRRASEILPSRSDPPFPYLENFVYRHTSKDYALAYTLGRLNWIEQTTREDLSKVETPQSPDAVALRARHEQVQCQRARTARMLQAECGFGFFNRSRYCSLDNRNYATMPQILQALDTGEMCPEIANAPTHSLAFDKMVPVPRVEAFLATIGEGLE